MNQKEFWKVIPRYKGFYEISSHGIINSLERKIKWKNTKRSIRARILKQTFNLDGYLTVRLYKSGAKTLQIHQLMAITFLGHKIVVDHKDFDKTNNHLSNLRLITNRENCNRKHINHTSIYTGVSWVKSREKWISQIMINNEQKYLGIFINEIDAHKAYKNALVDLK